MKKAKKIAVVGALLAGTAIGLVGCGEIYVSFNGYDSVEKWQYNKETFIEDINAKLGGLARAGYKVEGVYLDAEYTTPVSSLQDVKGDVTLYIKWEFADITIKFDANGGVGSIPDQTIKYTQSARLSDAANAFTKTGHKFTGWNTKSDGTGRSYNNNALFTMDSTSTITLYAQYTAQPYSVSYNKNAENATGTIANGQVTFGNTFSVTSKKFERKGYDFAGWNTKQDGSGTKYNAGDQITLAQEGMTLYAMWSAKSYNIVYDKYSEDATGTVAGQNNIKYDSQFTTSEGGYTRTGYGLAGWSTEPNGQGVRFGLGDEVTLNVVPDNGDTITLYAIWEANPAVTANDLYKNVTIGGNAYELAMIVGKTYSFDAVEVESITDASEDGVATISNGSITINKAGSFSVCLADKEDNNIKFNYAVIAMGTNYSISYWNMDDESNPRQITSANVGGYEFLDKAAYNTYTSYTYATGYNNGNGMPGVTKAGYEVAWALVDGAYIGGEYKPAGTIITALPAKTFGDIKLKAVATAKEYSYRFNVWDSEGHYSDTKTTITAKFGTTDWTTADGYSADLKNPGAIDGYTFVGWYTSNTDYSDSNKFDGRFDAKFVGSSSDIAYLDVYARYIKDTDLAAPTNVAVSSAQIITWDAVTAPDGFDIEYLITIGNEEYTSTTNLFDASTIINFNGYYSIVVAAKYSIRNNAIDFTASKSVESQPIEYNYVKKNNGIVRVMEGSNAVKLIMYTGMTYDWSYTDKDSPNLITIETEDDELVTYSKKDNDDNSAKVTIQTGDKTGTFYMLQAGNRRLVEVVENITAVGVGNSYSNYKTATGENSTFLDKEQMSVSGDYLVGTGNAFRFDINLYNSAEKGNSTTFDFANEEYTTFVFEVETEAGTWVNADGLYYYPATNTFSETLAAGGVAAKVTRNGAEFTFNEGLEGVHYRATMYLTYSRGGNNAENIELTKVGDKYVVTNLEQIDKVNTCVFEFTINNGVNVYTSDELKAAYGNFNIHCINIHRDIKATLDEEQMQANGSPINVQSGKVFDNEDTTSDNATEGTTRKTDGNIYKRVSRTRENDIMVVNGNFCTVDAYDVKPIDVHGKAGGAGEDGPNHCTGTQVCLGFDDYIRPQTGIFRYQVPKNNNSTCIFNSLNIKGNRKGEETVTLPDVTDPNYTEKFHEMDVMNSGSLVGIYNENSRIVVNNCNFVKLYHGVRADSAVDMGIAGGSKSYSEFNYCKVTGAYDVAIYGWNLYEARIFNSLIENSDGPAISFSDTRAVKPILYLDKNTIVDNYVEGTGGYFAKWNLTQIAASFKSDLQGAVSGWGNSVLQEKSGAERFNFVFCYNPSEGEGEEYDQQGNKNQSYYKNYGVSTNVGGTKILCNADDDRAIGKVYDESGNVIGGYYYDGGVTTAGDNVRNIDFLGSSDPRISGGMYAFAETDAVSTTSFGALAQGTATILTEMSQAADATKTNAVRYASHIKALNIINDLCVKNKAAIMPEDLINTTLLVAYQLGNNATAENVIAGLKSAGVSDEVLAQYSNSINLLLANCTKKIAELCANELATNPFMYMAKDNMLIELCLNSYDRESGTFLSNPCAGVTDANVLRLVEELIIANTTNVLENDYTKAIVDALKGAGNETTVTNYLMAKDSTGQALATYLMSRLGCEVSVGNGEAETMIEVVIPFGSNVATGESSSYPTPLMVMSTIGSSLTNSKWSMNIPEAPKE